MTPAARLQAAIEMLAEILETPRPADAVISAYFRSRRFIGSKDRQALHTRVWRVIRHYHRLGWWLARFDQDTTARGLVLADVMIQGEANVDSLPSLFSGERYAPDPLSFLEKNLAQSLRNAPLTADDMPLAIRLECPEWAFDPLQKSLSDDFILEMEAMQNPAPLDIRINPLKTDRETVLDHLRQDGIEATEGHLSPLCIRIQGRPSLVSHPLYQNGSIEIQDQGSQMVAILADAKPGEQVVDFCAGAGGKTLALGANMNNKGRIVALDVLGRRLEKARIRFRRAGLHNIETREMTGAHDKFVKRHVKHFDLVLVDAPCSGTGTWRRDPDKRWRSLGPDLSTLVPLQAEILAGAQRMVKPGGRLVYATCSLLKEENEDQIAAFLKAHSDFTVQRQLRLTPARDQTDGFYIAILTRALPP